MAPFKSSLARSAGKLFGVFKETDLSLRGVTQSSRLISSTISASGGTKIPSGGNIYHVFTFPNSDNFVVSSGNDSIEALIIGGGGGGGTHHGGGAGAGGVLHHPGFTVSAGTTYVVTIGDGGAGALPGPGSGNGTATYGANGSNSYFGPPSTPNGYTADGGGAAFPSGRSGSGSIQPLVYQNAPPGSNPYQGAGLPGGSGGGTGEENNSPGGASTQNPMNGATGYGNAGGASASSGNRQSSGGGAGSVGGAAPGGSGGDGRTFPSFPAPVIAPAIPSPQRTAFINAVGSGTFAGGGGNGGPGEQPGGPGGGGNGGAGPNPGTVGGAGVYGTGSGGGGGGGMGTSGGAGGSGIIIIKYSE